MSSVLFVGGGSVGHLAPAIAVAEAFKRMRPEADVLFVCAPRREEIELLRAEGMPFVGLNAPRFPRGFTLRHLTFPFAFLQSLLRARRIIRESKPAAVFSKGGYVSVPVCIAAWVRGIPLVLHESDAVTGLGNRLMGILAGNVCRGFPRGGEGGEKDKIIFTGNPVRSMFAGASRDSGLRITGFSGRRPIIMVIGGSQGAQAINEAIEPQLDALLELGDVIHITGIHKEGSRKHARYWVRPFVVGELPHLYAIADVVVSRAGAGVLSELAFMRKPALVIPLRGIAQDHQWENARQLADAGAVFLLTQEKFSDLSAVVRKLIEDEEKRRTLASKLFAFFPSHSAESVARVLLQAQPCQ